MNLFGLFSSEEAKEDSGTDGDDEHEKACNISSHSWEEKHDPSYFGRARSRLSGEFIKVKKKHYENCSKCGKFRTRSEWIGKVNIDTENDELSVAR